MRHKSTEGFYSAVSLVDSKRDKKLNIGAIVYISGEPLKYKLNIREEEIKQTWEGDATVESLMAAAYLCRSRLERMTKEVPARADVDGLVSTRGGNVSFSPLQPFKLGCAPESILDKLFAEALNSKS